MAQVNSQPTETPFSVFLWGGKDRFDRRRELLAEFTGRPIFSKSFASNASLSRKDAWTRAALQARELIKLKLSGGWSRVKFLEAVHMLDDGVPVIPQFRIFLSNLESQMSDEQKATWIPKAESFEIFGSYSQTELGHGSNLRGLETTATFDLTTDEFEIESPTLSSTKFWIGAAGIWATHSLVVARLILSGKDHGNHLFLVQLRSLDTHQLMPGVEIYELGPKVFQGLLGMDNGALRFNKVRVPRSQMLARNAQVTREGAYLPSSNPHHSKGSMVTVRALMAEITGFSLLKGVAVAYIYTNFRRQFKPRTASASAEPGVEVEETKVFNYASVRYRLLPLLSKGVALVLVGRHIKGSYDEYIKAAVQTGDTAALEDLHLQTVGAKVYATEITGHGIETCRILCGGHGFSALSGFGRMYGNAISAVTYEGDNYLLAQQVPRAILKHWHAKSEASIPSLSYLALLRDDAPQAVPSVVKPEDWLLLDVQLWLLEQRLAIIVKQQVDHTASGRDTSFSVHALTMAHCDLVYWKGLWEVVSKADPAFREPLTSLAQVFSLSIVTEARKSLAGESLLSHRQMGFLDEVYHRVLNEFADSYAGKIVDGFGFTEWELDSVLARQNETPYEALMHGAMSSEMNEMKHLWPMIVEARKLWKGVESAKL